MSVITSAIKANSGSLKYRRTSTILEMVYQKLATLSSKIFLCKGKRRLKTPSKPSTQPSSPARMQKGPHMTVNTSKTAIA